MLDMKRIRTQTEAVKAAVASRGKNMDDVIDTLLALDEQRRGLIARSDSLKSEQNQASKDIPRIRKEGGDPAEILARMNTIKEEIKSIQAELEGLDQEQRTLLLSIPNVPHPDVPVGKDESENPQLRKNGTPREFSFTPKAHWDLGKDLGILDPEAAAKVTGSRFHFYKNLGAKLERSVINFYLNTHTEYGYEEILPPYMVNRASMTGTGQLPKFEYNAFKIANRMSGDETDDYFMIPTAEVPVTNMHRDEILDGARLPIKYAAYSACFRAEAGSAGRDTRGLIRQHQFNKVELVKFTRPEESYAELEKLTADAERVLQMLGLPYSVFCRCAGALGVRAASGYGFEGGMPSYGGYVEISSCSNFEDYQARRAAIRYKNGPKENAQLVHTLNGSGVAVGRTVAAILENYQNEDGSVTVPEVLRPYMGTDVIK
ncbi:MAG: serine--tRNA ligase [Clostridiales bacterium]|nr:serine--tRNA ligase [Clostridiales bacterium]